ncbi:MAG TPA: GrpB family protein [Pseudomonadales bacterium]|nr:GrpB family protein [Pseudomonadales bacterium]
MSGLMREVRVVPSQAAWPARFAAVAAELLPLCGDAFVGIEHIGSTSVPGLAAKPVIDILLLVRSVEALDPLAARFAALAFEARGEYGIAGRRFFVRETAGVRSHHVHAFAPGSPDALRHLDLRDYLSAHPEARDAYGALKQDLAARHPRDIQAYMDGKHAMIRELLEQAAHWRRQSTRFAGA